MIPENQVFKIKLLRNILIIFLFMTAALSTYNVFFIYPSFTSLVIENTKNDAARVAKYLAAIVVPKNGELSELNKGYIRDDSLADIQKIINSFGLNKLQIFSSKGEVIYSTDANDIGQFNQKKYFLEIVAKGKIHAEVVKKDAKSLEGQRVTADVVETYVPRMENDKFLGAFEIYYDITDRYQKFDKLLSLSSIVLFSVVFGLSFAIFLVWLKENRAITERRQVEKALRESEKRYRMLFEKAGDAIFVVEAEGPESGKISAANQAAADMHGYNIKEFSELNIKDLNQPGSEKKAARLVECILNGEWIKSEIEHLKKDGSHFPVEMSAGLLELGSRKFILAFYRDITEKKLIQAETVRTGQLASIGELAAGVAHEINNPINGIINCAQLLIDESATDSKRVEIYDRILKAGSRIAMIVRNLLSFSRDHNDEPDLVHLHSILADSLDLTETQLRKDGIKLRIHIPETIPMVKVRGHQIQQVFLNIISNARYSLNQKLPSENRDKIFAINEDVENIRGNRYVRVTFYDNGTGIPADILDRICNPFFSTKPTGVGTGLGLSISHSIIKDHGGQLIFDSVEGDYTNIIVDLPVAEEDNLGYDK